MSQPNNNNNNNNMTAEEFFAQNPQPPLEHAIGLPLIINPDVEVEFVQYDCEDEFQSFIPHSSLQRERTINGPSILRRDADLYILWSGGIPLIKSFVTFEIVPNRRYNKILDRIEKIDPTIEEEDRRLIVIARDPSAMLEEDYNRKMGLRY